MSGVNMTLRLREFRPRKCAHKTRDVVDAGGAVTWLWHRDADFKRALAELGDWKAPHGGWWRIENGESMAYFAADGSPGRGLTYFVRPHSERGRTSSRSG